jgi:hypothetical protein
MSPTSAILTFIGIPVGIFAVISLLVLASFPFWSSRQQENRAAKVI